MSVSFPSLVAGFNPTTIVTDLMAAYQLPLTALQTNQTNLGTDQTVVTGIQSDVSALAQTAYQMTLNATIGAQTATVTGGSSSIAPLSAQAGSTALAGSYSVTVKQLATSTSVTSSSPNGTTPAGIGQAVNPTALLSAAGFGQPITNGTFTVNGVAITIDSNTVLSDPTNLANSLVDKINSSGAGVTASLSNDAYGRPNVLKLISNSGQSLQLGSSADTSNFLAASGLAGGAIVGDSAANVTGASAAAGAISAAITINGTTVNVNQTDGTFTGAQNASYIQNAINAAKLGVTASVTGAGSDQLQLTQGTLGSQQTIAIGVSGTNAAAVGLANGTTQNGSDTVVAATPLGEVDSSTSLSANAFSTPLVPNSSGGGTFTVNGVAINWSTTDSLNNVLNRLNASSAQVRATYDSLTDRVTLSSTKTGGATISMADTSGNFLQSSHLLSSPTTSVPQQVGQNAIVNIGGVNNGNDLIVPSNTVTGYIPGVTLTLQQQSLTPATVTVSPDTETPITAVQNFVTAVNKLFTDINSATAVNSDPTKNGPLAGDIGLLGIENTLSQMLSGTVPGTSSGYQDLMSVGVSTGPIGTAPAAGSTTTYQLDTTALTSALESNPAAVQQLFIGSATNPGIAASLNTYLNGLNGTTGYFPAELQGLTSQQQSIGSQIKNMQALLNQRQAALTAEYTQLEATIAGLQSQQSQVAALALSLGITTSTTSSSGTTTTGG